jgi:hypothetical protein
LADPAGSCTKAWMEFYFRVLNKFVMLHTKLHSMDLKQAFDAGKIPDAMNDLRYYNIKTMQAVNLK